MWLDKWPIDIVITNVRPFPKLIAHSIAITLWRQLHKYSEQSPLLGMLSAEIAKFIGLKEIFYNDT